MKRTFLLLSLFLVSAISLKAIVAKPGPLEIPQPDGSVRTLYLHGDEYLSYFSDASGNLFQSDEKGRLKPFALTEEMKKAARNSRREFFSSLLPILPKEGGRTKGNVKHDRVLVLLVSFSDNDFSVENPRELFSDMCNREGYNYEGATGSVRDYYVENSMGQYLPEFDVCGPYKLSHDMAHYGAHKDGRNDADPWGMAREALDSAYVSGVDFSQYANENGAVDYYYIYYAGYSEAEGASGNTIWPHSSSVGGYSRGGISFGTYSCSSELSGRSGKTLSGIGSFCHEFGHALGLPDLYDTDYEESGGESVAVGDLSLMDMGCYNNNSRTPPYLMAEERVILDWMETSVLTEGDLSLKSIDNNVAYRLETENGGEYFLFENRQKKGWDKYISTEGLLIYHVDRSENIVYENHTARQMWSMNAANTYPLHECMKVVMANGKSISGAGYPGKSGVYTEFTSASNPPSVSWSGLPLSLELTGISVNGDGVVSFTSRPTQVGNLVMGTVSDRAGAPLKGAQLNLLNEDNGDVLIAVSDSKGKYSFPATVASGHYLLRCQMNDYCAQELQLVLDGAPKGVFFKLAKVGEPSLTATWASYAASGIGSDEDFRACVRWDPGDISSEGNLLIHSVTVGFYSNAGDVKVSVYVDGILSGEKTVLNKSLKDGNNVIDLSDMQIGYRNSQSLRLAIDCKGGTYLYIDEGPAVLGKGDLYADFGKDNWADLYDFGFDGNWLIGVDFSEEKGVVPVDSLVILPSELTLTSGDEFNLMAVAYPSDASYPMAEWSTSNSSVASVDAYGHLTAVAKGTAVITARADQGRATKECVVTVLPTLQEGLETYHGQQVVFVKWTNVMNRWKISLESESGYAVEADTMTAPRYVFTGLAPETEYTGRVEAYDEVGEVFATALFSVKTDAALERPMCIGYMPETFRRNGFMLLEVLNLAEGASVNWKLDGKALAGNLLPYGEGEHLLQAEIKLPGSQGTEIIRRKIVMGNGSKGTESVSSEAKRRSSVTFNRKNIF